MRPPFAPIPLLLAVAALILLLAFVQVGLLTLAFDKLGLSAGSGFALLFLSLLGSAINLPVVTVDATAPGPDLLPPPLRSVLRHSLPPFTGRTVIAVNVGGGLIPVLFSAYLLAHSAVTPGEALAAIAVVAAVSYGFSRPMPGLGIGMPIFVAPITAALAALLIAPHDSAPLAYICGTLGVLVGADLLRLKDVRRLGTPLAAIGGAGTFDGIFITGIVAALLV